MERIKKDGITLRNHEYEVPFSAISADAVLSRKDKKKREAEEKAKPWARLPVIQKPRLSKGWVQVALLQCQLPQTHHIHSHTYHIQHSGWKVRPWLSPPATAYRKNRRHSVKLPLSICGGESKERGCRSRKGVDHWSARDVYHRLSLHCQYAIVYSCDPMSCGFLCILAAG